MPQCKSHSLVCICKQTALCLHLTIVFLQLKDEKQIANLCGSQNKPAQQKRISYIFKRQKTSSPSKLCPWPLSLPLCKQHCEVKTKSHLFAWLFTAVRPLLWSTLMKKDCPRWCLTVKPPPAEQGEVEVEKQSQIIYVCPSGGKTNFTFTSSHCGVAIKCTDTLTVSTINSPGYINIPCPSAAKAHNDRLYLYTAPTFI